MGTSRKIPLPVGIRLVTRSNAHSYAGIVAYGRKKGSRDGCVEEDTVVFIVSPGRAITEKISYVAYGLQHRHGFVGLTDSLHIKAPARLTCL